MLVRLDIVILAATSCCSRRMPSRSELTMWLVTVISGCSRWCLLVSVLVRASWLSDSGRWCWALVKCPSSILLWVLRKISLYVTLLVVSCDSTVGSLLRLFAWPCMLMLTVSWCLGVVLLVLIVWMKLCSSVIGRPLM